MHVITDWLQASSLTVMFLASLLLAAIAGWLITLSVRISLRLLGYGEGVPFPLSAAVATATSAIFALMIAFSGAGIWSDGNQARAAVQREANALENVRSIAESFPSLLRERTLADVQAYAQQVLQGDWPAMLRNAPFTDSIYDKSEKFLIDLIEAVARESVAAPLPNASMAIAQIVEVRSARLQRISLATQGVSAAQWLAMLVIAGAAMFATAILHNHERTAQYVAMVIYTACVSAAVFVILAHDRPFIGEVSVSAQPIEQILVHGK
jgi:hypothetical protein